MKPLRVLLIVGNTLAVAVLLAIPIGKLFGVVEEEVNAAAMFGWFIYFVPTLASVLALWGIQFSRSSLTRLFVTVAMPGSFLVAILSFVMYLRAPSAFAQIGIGAAILLGLNVLALWEPFRERVAEVDR
jgi:hypothetical protein